VGFCSACHAGHASDQKPLLKAARADLCLTCHKQHSEFSHPFGPNVIDPRTKEAMTCLSCHAPHGTPHVSLLTENPQRALCVQCHASDGPTLHAAPTAGGGDGAPSRRPQR
jgi:predicted CXXCH cytochrome family protein